MGHYTSATPLAVHAYMPLIIKGMKVHPENPILFDFIVDTGHSGIKISSPAFKDQSQKLIKYFLAALTIKEKDLWVNLSPYEKDRMLSADLGKTQMGQEMLAQDYLLKQLTASFMDPEKDLGRKFWDRIYSEARAQFGTSDIPVDTFNKVWIMADKARVFERDGAAFVVASNLKVMLDSDYLAMQQNSAAADVNQADAPTELSKKLIRQIILPAIEQEINEGVNFAPLRQMFHSMILATWYKKALKDALLNQVYTDKGKTGGVTARDPKAGNAIFEKYIAAYRAGAVNLIKEEADPQTGEMIARKYFSGGVMGEIPLTQTRNPQESEVRAGLKSSGENAELFIKLDFAERTDNAAGVLQRKNQVTNEQLSVGAAPDADEYEKYVDQAEGSVTVTATDLLKRDPRLKIASDVTRIKDWVSPHGVSLPETLKSIIKEYDIRGYDGGDDENFPTQIDPFLWQWLGRALGSIAFTSEAHGRTVSLQPGDFYLIAGDNGPSTGGQQGMTDQKGRLLPNVIEAMSQGLMDAGINVINLSIVGSGAMYSTISSLMEELKKSPAKLRATLKENGLVLSDSQFENLKRVKGGVYITRSHVEVGTNGAKPNVDGITLYAGMLQAMMPYIEEGVYREVAPENRGHMLKSDWIRETALDIYAQSIREQFAGLRASLDEVARMAKAAGRPESKVFLNFNGGSLAATERVNKEKFYAELFKNIIGDHLKKILRSDGDPWNKNGGLADPTRSDEKGLSHPKANIIKLSQENPDDIFIIADLDADRIAIVQNGRSFLGDEMFYPVIESQLTLDTYREIYRTQVPFLSDSRMKSEFAFKVRKHGGIAELHDKGHSKVKATIDVTLAGLVKQWGLANNNPNATKEEFLKAHPGFSIAQAEYSTHMFLTDKYGNAFDDAVRFAFFWMQAFAKVLVSKGKFMTLAEYIQADKDDPVNPLPDSKQMKEQRTSVSYIDANGRILPVSVDQKKALIYRMTDKVKAYFAGRDNDFNYITDRKQYKEGEKAFSLVVLDGVYHLFINKPGFVGEIFWGWSNTSNKIAFGTQSPDVAINKKIAEFAVALLVYSRKEIAAETKLNWIRIEDTETAGLKSVFSDLKSPEYTANELQGEFSADRLVDMLRRKTGFAIPEGAGIEYVNKKILTYRFLYLKYMAADLTPEEILRLSEEDLMKYNRKLIDDNDPKVSPKNQLRAIEIEDAVTGEYPDAVAAIKGTIDNAALRGGIDLNGNAMGMDIQKSGKGVTMTFDPAMADRFRKGDFTGLTPVIIRIVPIASPAAMLGLDTTPALQQQVSLADPLDPADEARELELV